MRAFGRFVVVLAAAIGGLVASQFPEYAQQYRQRLGGALEEMRQFVADFDADARRNELSREQALETYGASDAAFLRDQGATVKTTVERFEWLSEQRQRLEAAPAYLRPVVVLSGPDERVARGAWSDFEPGVPLTPTAFVWAAIGFFALGGLASLIRQSAGIVRRRRRRAAISA